MSYLILIRHGQSRWNLANKFTGWVDVPLSERGIFEALQAAKDLQGLDIHIAFTSELVRAHQTLFSVLASQDRTAIMVHDDPEHEKWYLHPHTVEPDEIPVYQDKALNERFYGDLQGMDKDQARKEFGEEQVFIWRRSYDIQPPNGESLKDVYDRSVPYFEENILPLLKEGNNIIVSAHGNSLRSIIKHLDGISDEEIPNLELPTGKPIVYNYEDGTLTKENHTLSFNRPVHWQEPKPHDVHNA